MFHGLVVSVARKVFPVGVLLDALPPICASSDLDKKSRQVKRAWWYRGGQGVHPIAKLERSGSCDATLTVGETVLTFDVFAGAKSLATLRIRELDFESENEEHDVD